MMTVPGSQKTYADAVSVGLYDLYDGGLSGSHDNIRIYWEDQIRGMRLRPYLRKLVERRKKEQRKVRIADLGSGSGEGLRLLTSWNRSNVDLDLHQAKVLPAGMVESYVGCDISGAMVEQGNRNFRDLEHVRFVQGDFSQGFPLAEEAPFDLYFCTYGSFSHISGESMEHLLTEMVEHAHKRALIAGDWLGRYSIEWPCYWNCDADQMLDYSMSYMPGAVGGNGAPEHFPMRFWTGDELRSMVERVARKTGARIQISELYDCSIFVGRHVDTREYNEWVRPLRRAVSSLHESNVRTDLECLRAEVIPVDGSDERIGQLVSLQFAWNSLIDYCLLRLGKRIPPMDLANWRQYPSVLQMGMVTMDRIIDTAHWVQMGDPRANIIEPQLGYALRDLEMDFQRGRGQGHALVGILEVRK